MIEGLDPVIHVPKRLAAMAMLANASTVSFRFLREQLNISESDLSKQMSTLEAAGYVTSNKDGYGRGAGTQLFGNQGRDGRVPQALRGAAHPDRRVMECHACLRLDSNQRPPGSEPGALSR